MSRSHKLCVGLWAFWILGLATSWAQDDTDKVDFVRDIKPIFESKCLRCHGPVQADGFRIDLASEALEHITAGDAEDSDLYNYLITDDEDELMPPPSENDPLTPDQIELVKRWIDQGAEWPEGVTMQEPADESPVESGDGGVAAGDEDRPARPARKKEDLTMAQKIWKAIGALHPASVHLPVGLLMAAGLFALLGLTGNFVMSDTAYYCLWLGALTAIFASVVGWSQSINLGGPTDLTALTQPDTRHYWHRIAGVGVTIFALLLALYAARARSLDPDNGTLWKLGAIVLAVGVSYCGYEGGKITHKSGHYNYLNSVVNEIMGWNGDNKVKEPAANESSEKPNEEKESEVGKTSDETEVNESGNSDKLKADIAD
ncbi:MAG: hypothetical protein KF851_09475 [Pirellulaceae bacterium]|nr:hypothetical protein [Pirellulaceae bacterium]